MSWKVLETVSSHLNHTSNGIIYRPGQYEVLLLNNQNLIISKDNSRRDSFLPCPGTRTTAFLQQSNIGVIVFIKVACGMVLTSTMKISLIILKPAFGNQPL